MMSSPQATHQRGKAMQALALRRRSRHVRLNTPVMKPAGAKAFLEHNIRLNLVADRFPKGIEKH